MPFHEVFAEIDYSVVVQVGVAGITLAAGTQIFRWFWMSSDKAQERLLAAMEIANAERDDARAERDKWRALWRAEVEEVRRKEVDG